MSKFEEMSEGDDESDKHLEARDRRYSCLITKLREIKNWSWYLPLKKFREIMEKQIILSDYQFLIVVSFFLSNEIILQFGDCWENPIYGKIYCDAPLTKDASDVE